MTAALIPAPTSEISTPQINVCDGLGPLWPTSDELSKFDLDVALFWQLPRFPMEFNTDPVTGRKKVSDKSIRDVRDLLSLCEGDTPALTPRAVRAMASWEAFIRYKVWLIDPCPHERGRCLAASKLWVSEYGEKMCPILAKTIRDIPEHSLMDTGKTIFPEGFDQ